MTGQVALALYGSSLGDLRGIEADGARQARGDGADLGGPNFGCDRGAHADARLHGVSDALGRLHRGGLGLGVHVRVLGRGALGQIIVHLVEHLGVHDQRLCTCTKACV